MKEDKGCMPGRGVLEKNERNTQGQEHVREPQGTAGGGSRESWSSRQANDHRRSCMTCKELTI